MTCNEVRENLIELLDEGQADSLSAHVRQCQACTEELESLRKTMSLLDEWEAPEPSPYFLTRMRAHVKEEREKAPARSSILSWMRRPAMAISLATVLVAGGAVYTVLRPFPESPTTETTAVADVEALDRNHDVLVNTDLIDEMSGGPSDDVSDVDDVTEN
jgi:hypothetical protein